MKLNDLYHFIRKILFEIMLFFFLQSFLWSVLAVIIVLYPYALNLLVALSFFLFALIGIYVMIRVAVVFHQVKKIKQVLKK